MDLQPADFASFFRAIHGCNPFPWQQELIDRLAASDAWPDVLELPTGSGKTAALDAAVFHLALRVDAPSRAALRIALVVDRRLVVDDAFERANRIADSLHRSARGGHDEGAVVEEVARRLQHLAGKGCAPLVAQRLRGGMPLEHDWARTPTQPTVLCSTVDQVGSRLLFRGYGVSDRMKPVHAGLLGSNSLILLDEAHLAEPFRQTLECVRQVGRAGVKLALLSATPGTKPRRPLELTATDRRDPTLRRRLKASKPAALKPPIRGELKAAVLPFVNEARSMAARLQQRGVSPCAVGIVVNRVSLARDIYDVLAENDATESVLMIGPSRSVDRDAVVNALTPFRTAARERGKAKSLFLVATQCLEVGVDLDLDGLVTQAASLDALRQRFGRLNREGRPNHAEGTIVTRSADIAKKNIDPVYGDRIRRTWDALQAMSDDGTVDFGIDALTKSLAAADGDPDELVSEKPSAPVLMPAYLDLWSQTWPRPTADPEISLFLHGAKRTAGVSIVWRDDVFEEDFANEQRTNVERVISLMPPRVAEAVEVPLGVARAWLGQQYGESLDVSDAPEQESQTQDRPTARLAYRWAGRDDHDTGIVRASRLRPGDVLVVPSRYGGCDRFGWNPRSDQAVEDVAERAQPYIGRRCAVRVTRTVVQTDDQWAQIASVLAAEELSGGERVERLLAVLPPQMGGGDRPDAAPARPIRQHLEALHRAKGDIDVHFPYAGGWAGGAILIAEQGVKGQDDTGSAVPATEDDSVSHGAGRQVTLDDHGCHVARYAKIFAQTIGLEDLEGDLALAAYLHDAGKADPRFQIMLSGGDPWNRPDGVPLAKGGRPSSPQAWRRSGLPRGWRHEALSVRMARMDPRLTEARDPALVLWLIGSHHGFGRPFFNFLDHPSEAPSPCLGVTEWRLKEREPGPQSLAFDLDGLDWPSLFDSLKQRYGIWGLAHLEAILRLADHRASEEERGS